MTDYIKPTIDVFARQERDGTFTVAGATFSKKKGKGIHIYVQSPFGDIYLPANLFAKDEG